MRRGLHVTACFLCSAPLELAVTHVSTKPNISPGLFFCILDDPRFAKHTFFLRVSHTLVALWALLIGLPVYLVCFVAFTGFWNEELFTPLGERSPPATSPCLNLPGYASLGLYASALLLEITADHQKIA